MSEVDQTTQDTPAQEQPQIGLTLQDLRVLAGAVELGAQRGAFRADELSQVGGLYDRIVAFLQASGALAPADKPADSTETPAE